MTSAGMNVAWKLHATSRAPRKMIVGMRSGRVTLRNVQNAETPSIAHSS